MKQTDLANASGVSQSQISRIEAGRINATRRTLQNLADALGVSLGQLIPGVWVAHRPEPPRLLHLFRLQLDPPVHPQPSGRPKCCNSASSTVTASSARRTVW
jgi:transcriptional regulator with XRE-family HTH domain